MNVKIDTAEIDTAEIEAQVEAQIEAVGHLAKVASWRCGASGPAASVLLHAWNDMHPIRQLLTLDADNRRAALAVIQGTLEHGWEGGTFIEQLVGRSAIERMCERYGREGSWWS